MWERPEKSQNFGDMVLGKLGTTAVGKMWIRSVNLHKNLELVFKYSAWGNVLMSQSIMKWLLLVIFDKNYNPQLFVEILSLLN